MARPVWPRQRERENETRNTPETEKAIEERMVERDGEAERERERRDAKDRSCFYASFQCKRGWTCFPLFVVAVCSVEMSSVVLGCTRTCRGRRFLCHISSVSCLVCCGHYMHTFIDKSK